MGKLKTGKGNTVKAKNEATGGKIKKKGEKEK